MEPFLTLAAPWLIAGGATAALLPRAWQRLQLSRAKHRSLAGHSKMAKRVARLMPRLDYDEERFFGCDGAPADVVARRRAALERLARGFAERSPRTTERTRELAEGLSDLQFTAAYRVPFPFSRHLRSRLRVPALLRASHGHRVVDLDGQELIDLTGSYGVNVLGYDTYKACIEQAVAEAGALGPVLGPYHEAVLDNVQRLREISGLDEVSFHMSGTEAVMQAVRLARYHTKRSHLVRFCGAYHGWWEDVQPGPGNPVDPPHTYTLQDMSERSLQVLRSRRDIACVLVNPLQALHPNKPAPGDSALLGGGGRSASYDRAAYTRWLTRLRQVCTERGIVLIFDEVFMGFRLAPGGAQQYFGVRADLVTYGKTLGGGLPVGVVCGRQALMKRWRDERPADICFARGTFNAHPYVMGAMRAFLQRLQTPAVQALYHRLDERWDARAAALNARLEAQRLPLRVANLQTVWTMTYTCPSRYHWMLQFYLREAGLALSWVGSGRLIFSLDVDDAAFGEVADRIVAAAHAMQADGWWWRAPHVTNAAIGRGLLKELVLSRA